MPTPKNCRRCARALSRRSEPVPTGNVMHFRRGLCRICHFAASTDGTITQYPTLGDSPGRPATSNLAEDFNFLVESIGGIRTDNRIGWDVRTRFKVAQRLGVSLDTLDRALYRDMDRQAA